MYTALIEMLIDWLVGRVPNWVSSICIWFVPLTLMFIYSFLTKDYLSKKSRNVVLLITAIVGCLFTFYLTLEFTSPSAVVYKEIAETNENTIRSGFDGSFNAEDYKRRSEIWEYMSHSGLFDSLSISYSVDNLDSNDVNQMLVELGNTDMVMPYIIEVKIIKTLCYFIDLLLFIFAVILLYRKRVLGRKDIIF